MTGLGNGSNTAIGQPPAFTSAPAVNGFASSAGTSGITPLGLVGSPGSLSGSTAEAHRSAIRGGIARGSSGSSGLDGRALSKGWGENSTRVLGSNPDASHRAGTGTASSGLHGSNSAHTQHGRGIGPALAPAMPGRSQDKKKPTMIKTITSRIEADKNRRDLLGEPPAALPGPIGNWARE